MLLGDYYETCHSVNGAVREILKELIALDDTKTRITTSIENYVTIEIERPAMKFSIPRNAENPKQAIREQILMRLEND